MQIRGQLLAIFLHRGDVTIEVAVGGAFHHGELRRLGARFDIGLQHPAKIEVHELPVAGLDQITGNLFAILPFQRLACGAQALHRHQLPVVDLANQDALVAACIFKLPLIDGMGPEIDQTTPANQQQQTQYGHQTQADGAPRHPDPGGPRFKPLTHCRFLSPYRELYFSRNRWRTNSARVLNKKVNTNSTKAARKSTR